MGRVQDFLPLSSCTLPFSCMLFRCRFFWSVPEINTVAARYVTQAKHLELYGTPIF